MAEQIELSGATEALAREIFVRPVMTYDGLTREQAEAKWDNDELPHDHKFYYRETAMQLIIPVWEPIARQVWAMASESSTELGDYPGFEVSRG